jgi:hypothetical protein
VAPLSFKPERTSPAAKTPWDAGLELGERYLMPDGTLSTQSCLSTTR